jgi:hypothetical protein
MHALAPALTALPLLAALCMIPVSVSRCSLDADPLMGVYGYALCPKVCDGCDGRVRVVTAWHQTGPGEYSSDGAEYFCSSPSNGVATLSDEQLEQSRASLGGASLSFLAAAGASYLLLLLLLSPLVPVWATARWLRHRAALQRLDADVAAAAAELGLAAPYPPAGPSSKLGGAVLRLALATGGAVALVVIGLGLS